MEWNRSETLALAAERCTTCRGLGRNTKSSEEAPCHCVLRAIFRACYKRFRECANQDLASTRASFERGATQDPGGAWGRRNEEYVADFLLVAKRALSEEDYKLFRYHYVLGADWRLCCRKLGLEKGRFFHLVYRIQTQLGRVFRELQPYALYPLREYFTAGPRSHTRANVVEMPRVRPTLDVPVSRAA